MASYEFRCEECGAFTVRVPMRDVTPEVPCPTCTRPARRRYTAPYTRRTASGLTRALDAAEESRHEPRVVDSIPSRAGPGNVTTHPLHRRLPRP
jgi:putative FmdB family regulatory protein